jgi:hypothetical protein
MRKLEREKFDRMSEEYFWQEAFFEFRHTVYAGRPANVVLDIVEDRDLVEECPYPFEEDERP